MEGSWLGADALLIFIVAIVAVIATDVVAQAARVYRLRRVSSAEGRVKRLTDASAKLASEHRDVQRSLSENERVAATLERRIGWTEEQIGAEVKAAVTIEHELGSRGRQRDRWRARVVPLGDGVRQPTSGVLKPMHPAVSGLPHHAVIWAGTEREASHLFATQFPSKLGYAAHGMTFMDRSDAAKEQASAEAAQKRKERAV
jgi:hypothetical protein